MASYLVIQETFAFSFPGINASIMQVASILIGLDMYFNYSVLKLLGYTHVGKVLKLELFRNENSKT